MHSEERKSIKKKNEDVHSHKVNVAQRKQEHQVT